MNDLILFHPARLMWSRPAVAGLKHTFCGAMAGAITKTSVAPLERVKIIMQVHGMKDGGTAEKLGIISTGRVSRLQ